MELAVLAVTSGAGGALLQPATVTRAMAPETKHFIRVLSLRAANGSCTLRGREIPAMAIPRELVSPQSCSRAPPHGYIAGRRRGFMGPRIGVVLGLTVVCLSLASELAW